MNKMISNKNIFNFKNIVIASLCFFILISIPTIIFIKTSHKKINRYVPPASTPVSKEMLSKYQQVNASVYTAILDRTYFGPHEGPGIVTGIDGPIIMIQWFNSPKKKEMSTRYLPISSIINIDNLLNLEEAHLNFVVYYKGPFGNIEWALCTDAFFEKLRNRWKSYLLSQETMR